MIASERRRLLIVLAAAAAMFVVWLAYSPARHAVLVGEDHTLVRRDTRWQNVPLATLFARPLWPESQLSDARVPHFRPSALATYRLDHALGGGATELHFTSVLLHVVACGLLAWIAARLGARGGAAVLGALVWALAPRLTESVVWISARPDLLAGTLGLAALAVSPDVTWRAPSSRAPAAWTRGIASAMLLFLALASNDTALAFAVALAVAAVVRRSGEQVVPRTRLVRAAATTLGPLVGFLALRANAVTVTPSTALGRGDLGLGERALLALEAIGRYVEMTVVAHDPRTSIGAGGSLDAARVGLGLVAVAGVLLVSVRLRRRLSIGVWVGGALGCAALAVAVARGPLGSSGAVAADRLLYVPLAGLFIVLAASAARLDRAWARAAAAAALGIAVVFAGITKGRAEDYGDEVGFWVEAAERSHPENPHARSSLAVIVNEHGRTDLACRLFEASAAIHEASGSAGSVGHRRARESRATCLARLGRFDEALRTFDELAVEHPDVGRVHLGRAYVRLHLFDFEGAERDFARAVSIDPLLAPIAAAALRELEHARADAADFVSAEDRRSHRRAYADFLASAGRLKDAAREMAAVAEDPSAPDGARKSAVWFLVRYGDVAVARRAARSTYGTAIADIDEDFLRAREEKLARVALHEARIEHLAVPASVLARR